MSASDGPFSDRPLNPMIVLLSFLPMGRLPCIRRPQWTLSASRAGRRVPIAGRTAEPMTDGVRLKRVTGTLAQHFSGTAPGDGAAADLRGDSVSVRSRPGYPPPVAR